MKKVLLFSITALCLFPALHAQVTCNATTFNVDLSASIDTTVSFQSTRNGDCCSGNNCIRFNLKLNPACSYVNFSVMNPAPPGNAAYYQIDCGTPTSLGTPICIVGKTDVVISFCKPGNDNPIYTITAAGALKGSDDITVREGCTGTMNVSGLQTATINWTSIYPGIEGAYDSWLSCTSACSSVNVIPQTGAPAYVDYKVSGYRLCGPLVSDIIRVYTTPQIGVSVSPANPSVCAGGSSSVTLTASANGGDAPYNFVWNTGQTGPSVTVSSGATYTVSVTDIRNCLPATQSVIVNTTPLPPTPVISTNAPVCEGATLQLSVPAVAGATYSWTGPNGFTSTLQNPTVNNVSLSDAGTYSVIVTVGQCSSLPANASIAVNATPPSPVVNSNSPVCEGSNLTLTATSVAGAIYNWTGPNGFNSTKQNTSLNSVGLANAGDYSLAVTFNGCSSPPSSLTVVVNALPPAPVISTNSPICAGGALSLNANTINNAIFSWTGPDGFSSSQQNPVISNAGLTASGSYMVQAGLNGCTGAASTVLVTVNPIPQPPALSSNQPICAGSDLNLTASVTAGASYNWSGPNGFTSTTQNPDIATASTSASGVYSAYLTVNGCNSSPSTILATVNPIPSIPVVSGSTIICEGGSLFLSATPVPSASYKWNGPNGFSSSASSISISNVSSLHNGPYYLTTTLNGCASAVATTNVVVNRLPLAPHINSNSPVCSGELLSFSVADLTGASYAWTGPNGFTSAQQNPVLSNVSLVDAGNYYLFVTVSGCRSASAASAVVAVNQTPAPPQLTNNGPLCEGANLSLSAIGIPGGVYNWWGPDNFRSSLQDNSVASISSQQAGTYYATVALNGCTSSSASTTIKVDLPARLNAGPDQIICSNSNAVNLSGSIYSGNNTGIWSTSGNGRFSNTNTLITSYFPSIVDKASGNVTVYLSSVKNGACPATTASSVIRFVAPPSADAGPDQIICANDKGVVLQAQYSNSSGGVWTGTGTGSFQPSPANAAATYVPGSKDKTEGSVKLTWTTSGNGPCPAETDDMVVAIKQPPSIFSPGVQYVIENQSVVLKPVINGTKLKYSWTPAVFLDSDTIPNPVCTPGSAVSYKIFVSDEFGCSNSADLAVKLIRHPIIPNVFTPNGDGINDTWQIKNLADYADCVMDIYNRYGQLIHHCRGYDKDWDGTSNGKSLPAATYYYIIDLKTGTKPLSGFVDIVR